MSNKPMLYIRILLIIASFLFIFINVYLGILRTKKQENYVSPFFDMMANIQPSEIAQIEIHESNDIGKYISLKSIIDDRYSIERFVQAMKTIDPWIPNRPSLFGSIDMKIILTNKKEIYLSCFLRRSHNPEIYFDEIAFCSNPTSETYPKLHSDEKDKIVTIPRIKSRSLYFWLNNQGLLEF